MSVSMLSVSYDTFLSDNHVTQPSPFCHTLSGSRTGSARASFQLLWSHPQKMPSKFVKMSLPHSTVGYGLSDHDVATSFVRPFISRPGHLSQRWETRMLQSPSQRSIRSWSLPVEWVSEGREWPRGWSPVRPLSCSRSSFPHRTPVRSSSHSSPPSHIHAC